MLPAPLQNLADQADACEQSARVLVEGLTDAQLNWQATPGQTWSIGQCLDHLRATNVFYVRDFLPRVHAARERRARAFDGLAPGWVGRKFIASLEPPPRLRGKAFKAIVPASTVHREDVMAAYVTSHAPYRELLRASADVDVNRITGPNPFLRWISMSVATVLLAIPAHDRRHLWQARQVREHPAFPQ